MTMRSYMGAEDRDRRRLVKGASMEPWSKVARSRGPEVDQGRAAKAAVTQRKPAELFAITRL